MTNGKKIIDEKEMNEITFKKAEKDLHEYLDDMIHTAEWLLRNLKGYKTTLKDVETRKSKSGFTKEEDVVQWAINQAQQVNWHFDDGARFVGNYMRAKAIRGE